MSIARRARWASLAVVVTAAWAAPAAAFTVEGASTDGCHERISSDALRAVRSSLSTARIIDPDDDEQALIDDLPFSLPDDLRELAATTLLLGVRDNDLKGRGTEELDSIASVHGNPADQREHCLRGEDQDEPSGSDGAVQDCRSFLTERFSAALDGLDGSGMPDPARHDSIEVTLAIRGRIEVSLPTFWVRIGQALHTLQDSFTHGYRSEDALRIRTVLNWIDVVDKTHDESRDGPAHSMELDRCDDPDELRTLRRSRATDASIELLRASLDPALTPAEKSAAAEEVIARYVTYEPGCTFGNDWCDAPERQYGDDTGCACRTGRVTGQPAGIVGAAALLVGLCILRRRRRSRAQSTRWIESTALVAAAVGLFTGTATAQAERANAGPPPPPGSTPAEARAADVAAAKRAETDPEPWRSAFGIHAAASAAYDNLALAGALGARYRFARAWIAGLDAEYNPFLSVNGKTFRTGVFNGYATLIRRWPMHYEPVNLRTSASAGTSVLLMDLYGAPSGSVGLYLGASFLGIEWKVSRAIYVVLDPLNVALPAPQLTGIPFVYGQYRTTIGLELAP
jgi:hypothetical protein